MKLKDKEVYLIIKYKNIKHIYFRFDEENRLIASSPMDLKEADIKRVIKEKEEELYNLLVGTEEKNEKNKKFYYLGKEFEVIYTDKIDKVGFKDNKVYTKDDDALNVFWEKECLKVFEGEIKLCKQCFQSLPEFTLKTRKMKTRWGVCNTWKKQITLNTDLLKHPLEVIDYVIIHEMCHFFEGNHSKDFWSLVEAACPNYKELRARLKK